MKTRIMALSALAMFGIASTVNATPPVQDRFSTFVEGQYISSCGDFAVLADYYYDFSYKLFYDKSGKEIRDLFLVHNDGFTKYYNSEDHTRFVEGGPNEQQVQRIDVDGSSLALMGAGFRINLPGQGVILLMAGRLVVDLNTGEVLFEAGPQDLVEGNLDELCAALR